MFRRSFFLAAGGLTLLGTVAPRAGAQAMPAQLVRPAVPATPLHAASTPVARTPLFVPSVANQAINPNFLVAPGLTLPQAAYNTAVVGQSISQVPPYALGFNPYPQIAYANPLQSTTAGLGIGSPYSFGASALGGYGGSLQTSSYGGGYGGQGASSPYSSGYSEDPYAGYLRGVASVTGAEGNYLNQVQKARLEQVQADSSRLDLRRRILEEAATERKAWLNPEAARQRDLQDAYARAAHDPPVGEILSGRALNDLYSHVNPIRERMRTRGESGRDVPLDEDQFRQINWTGVGSSGSVGLLKNQGKLDWPLVLQSPDFEAARKNLDVLAADAVQRIRLNGPPAPGTLRDMAADVRRLGDSLLHKAGELSPSEYVEARRYVGELESAVMALQDPGVGRLFDPGASPGPPNVAELIDLMDRKGLRFAPATAGDEPAYRHVYQRLVTYDAALSAVVAKQ
jgi:hypothetical protein